MGEELQSKRGSWLCKFGWMSLLTVIPGQEIYRFDGSDEQLLEKIAEVYDEVRALGNRSRGGCELTDTQIKRTVAEEENLIAQFTQEGSIYSPLSDRQWEAFTQGGGALISPDFGPGGVGLRLDNTADAPFEKNESELSGPRARGGNGEQMVFETGVASGGFGKGIAHAGPEVRMFAAGPGKSRAR